MNNIPIVSPGLRQVKRLVRVIGHHFTLADGTQGRVDDIRVIGKRVIYSVTLFSGLYEKIDLDEATLIEMLLK